MSFSYPENLCDGFKYLISLTLTLFTASFVMHDSKVAASSRGSGCGKHNRASLQIFVKL